MLSPEDTHANLFPKLVEDQAIKMKDTSGQKCLELYEASGRDGSLPRMLLGILASVSTRLPHRWKTKTSPSGRLLFQLAPSMPRTGAIASGLWPTPTARDHKDGTAESCKNVPVNCLLGRAVHFWTTPCADDTGYRKEKCKQGGTLLSTQAGGSLNPTWVEWLMGYPEGWTDCELLETPSSPKSRKRSASQ